MQSFQCKLNAVKLYLLVIFKIGIKTNMTNKSTLITCLLIAVTTMLSGCVSSNRENSTAYAVKHSGKIAKENVYLFSDCMLNGFNILSGKFINSRTARQQIRSSMIRIDIFTEGGIFQTTSADIFMNGDVQFLVNINSNMALVSMSAETSVFNNCLDTFKLNS